MQSGQGADEVFAGYHWYPPLVDSSAPVDDYAHVFFDRDHASLPKRSPLGSSVTTSAATSYSVTSPPPAQRPIDKALRLDTQIMLVDDPAKRVDKYDDGLGLEARVPFLDHELVELAARIPAEFKIASGGKEY